MIMGGGVRRVRRSLGRRIAIALFTALNWVVPKARRKVLVHGIPDLEDGTRSVLAELIRRGLTPVVVVGSASSPERYAKVFGKGRALVAPTDSLRAAWHFLTAKYVFVTHGLFASPRPPTRQCVVNLWHGEPPGKVAGRYEDHRDQHATVAPVLSGLGQAFRCTEFGLPPSRVPVLGAPRNDRMLQADRASVKRRLVPCGYQKPTYLWMPTFRSTVPGRHQRTDVGSRYPALPFNPGDVRRLDEWLTRHDTLVVVKAHPAAADDLPTGLESIRFLSQADLEERDLTVYTALAGSDGLITDLSSVWIDYLLLRRPIVFAFPDIDEYRASRGISLEPYESWVPGPFVRSVDALTDALGALLAGQDDFSAPRELALCRRHRYHDDRSAKRVIDHAMARCDTRSRPTPPPVIMKDPLRQSAGDPS